MTGYQERPDLQGRHWHRLRVEAPIRRASTDPRPLIMAADIDRWRRFFAVIDLGGGSNG